MGRAPIDVPLGVVKRDSVAAVAGRYADTQWARFRDGKPEKIGGWQLISSALTGIVRGILAWTSRAGNDLVAAGTASKLYSIAAAVDDITPLSSTGTLANNPISTTNASHIVDIAHTAHGRIAGSLVTFSGATAVGGLTVSGEYSVTSITSANAYKITHASAASSTAGPGGGAAVAYDYELNPGLVASAFEDSLLLTEGDMQAGTDNLLLEGDMQAATDGLLMEGDIGRYGVFNEMRYWSIDTYGAYLLALPSGGTLYQWDEPSVAARAVVVSGAPAVARAMFVTSERFPILLGATTPMRMAWPDQDDITDWVSSSSNTANERTLQGGSKLMAGAKLAELLSIVWSDTHAFLMQYTGSEFVYDTRPISGGAGLIAPAAFTVANSSAYWLSKAGFLMFSGGLNKIPGSEDIRDYVLGTDDRAGEMDPTYAEKTWCGYNPKFNEVWFGYCSADATEPDRYVMVNLDNHKWSTGTLARTGASYHSSPSGSVIMAGADSMIYRHEVGKNGAGLAIESYVETGIVALKGSGRDTEFFSYIPDFERQVGSIAVELTTYLYPMSTLSHDAESITIEEGDTVADIRLEGRYAKMKVTSDEVDGDFRLGIPVLDTEQGGQR